MGRGKAALPGSCRKKRREQARVAVLALRLSETKAMPGRVHRKRELRWRESGSSETRADMGEWRG